MAKKKKIRRVTSKKLQKKVKPRRVQRTAKPTQRPRKGTKKSKPTAKATRVNRRTHNRNRKGNKRTGKTIVKRRPAPRRARKVATRRRVSKVQIPATNITKLVERTRERKDEITGEMITVPERIFQIKLPRGTFKQKVEYIRNLDVDAFIKKHFDVNARGIMASLHAKFKKKDYARNKIMPQEDNPAIAGNFKKFLLDRLIKWQDDYFERREEIAELDEEPNESDQAFNPDKLSSISIKIFY